jgi:hypothetical protein
LTSISAQDSLFAPFYSTTSYTDALKDKSSSYGVYFQSGKFKLASELKDVTFKSDNNVSDANLSYDLKDFTQTNFAMAYSFEYDSKLEIPLSFQYISSSNAQYDGIYSILTGVKKAYESFTLGAEYSYSSYGNDLLNSVQQISPYVIFTYGEYNSLMGKYQVKLSYDSISPDAKASGISSRYSASSIAITQLKGDFQNYFRYIGGKHIFAVRSGGLSIQNFEEIYDNVLIFSSRYNFSDSTALQLSYLKKTYTELGRDTDAKLDNILAFFYFKF